MPHLAVQGAQILPTAGVIWLLGERYELSADPNKQAENDKVSPSPVDSVELNLQAPAALLEAFGSFTVGKSSASIASAWH